MLLLMALCSACVIPSSPWLALAAFQFLVEFEDTGRQKYVKRINLMFEKEDRVSSGTSLLSLFVFWLLFLVCDSFLDFFHTMHCWSRGFNVLN